MGPRKDLFGKVDKQGTLAHDRLLGAVRLKAYIGERKHEHRQVS